jgi:hypothetical protein
MVNALVPTLTDAVTDPEVILLKSNPTIDEADIFVKPLPSPTNDPEKEPVNEPDIDIEPENSVDASIKSILPLASEIATLLAPCVPVIKVKEPDNVISYASVPVNASMDWVT